jgi:hypothetical protein
MRDTRLDILINLELDRLGWSSETAPPGANSLDAFLTETEGIVSLHDTQEITDFRGSELLTILQMLPASIAWEDLWQAILPLAEEEEEEEHR